MLALLRVRHVHHVAGAFDIFLNHHRIGAFGHRGAGGNAHRAAWREAAVESMPRRGFPDQPERSGGAGGDHRIAIHFRNREGRLVALCGHGLGQHPAQRFTQWHKFFRGNRDAAEHGGAGLGHRGEGGRDKFPLGRKAAL